MLAVQKVCLDVGGYLLFPLVSIIEQFLLVIQQFLMSLCRELKVWALRNKEQTHKMEPFTPGTEEGGQINQFLELKVHEKDRRNVLHGIRFRLSLYTQMQNRASLLHLKKDSFCCHNHDCVHHKSLHTMMS